MSNLLKLENLNFYFKKSRSLPDSKMAAEGGIRSWYFYNVNFKLFMYEA